MRQFNAFVLKEARHILRDSRTLMVLFGMPVVMMLLFGFAISTEVRNVRVVAVTSTMDQLTQKVTDRLDQSEYFTVVRTVPTPADAEKLMRNQKADMAVVFGQHFAARTSEGRGAVQIMSDAIDPNTASMQEAYARSIIQASMGGGQAMEVAQTSLLFNPQMKSAYNFVPGIMGMLLLIICAMMTSVSIVREKERGTMEVLLASPVRPIMIIIAKAVPYMVLSAITLTCILAISRYVLDVPIAGNIAVIAAVSLLYILLALSLGLLISVIAETQIAAMLMSAMVLLLPCMLLSGMIFPVESMPEILRWVSAIVPARWYISAVRKLMVMGVGFENVILEVSVMAAMTTLLLSVALLKFKVRLE